MLDSFNQSEKVDTLDFFKAQFRLSNMVLVLNSPFPALEVCSFVEKKLPKEKKLPPVQIPTINLWPDETSYVGNFYKINAEERFLGIFWMLPVVEEDFQFSALEYLIPFLEFGGATCDVEQGTYLFLFVLLVLIFL
jgi:hypothetical protein